MFETKFSDFKIALNVGIVSEATEHKRRFILSFTHQFCERMCISGLGKAVLRQ